MGVLRLDVQSLPAFVDIFRQERIYMSMNLGIDAVYYLLFVFELTFPCIFLRMFEYICLNIYDILHLVLAMVGQPWSDICVLSKVMFDAF